MPIARSGNTHPVTVNRGGRRIRKAFKNHALALRDEASVINRIDRGE